MALLIGVGSLLYTNQLVKKLSEEERKKVELWAEATRQISDINAEPGDISFALSVLTDNNTVPVILTDEANNIISTPKFGFVALRRLFVFVERIGHHEGTACSH